MCCLNGGTLGETVGSSAVYYDDAMFFCFKHLLLDLVYHVSFQLIRATPRVFKDVHINVHALAHRVVILASSDLGKNRGLVDVLGAEVVGIVPIFLWLQVRNRRWHERCS